ncbi:MAG: hypothetical protein K2X38_11550 [Gemmataceae bacterium]|nr:hypothetical protein [Gemmataceae bacterium]
MSEAVPIRCETCGADVTDELFCPACGAAVIPQKTKAQNRMAELQERARHQAITRMGLAMGFFVGACIGLYLFTTYSGAKEGASRSGWGCFLAFFPFYGAALGGGLGAAVSMLRHRRR